MFIIKRQLCVNGDWHCQWDKANFDPLQNRYPLTDLQKLSQVITLATPVSVPFGTNPFTGAAVQWVKYDEHYFLFV